MAHKLSGMTATHSEIRQLNQDRDSWIACVSETTYQVTYSSSQVFCRWLQVCGVLETWQEQMCT